MKNRFTSIMAGLCTYGVLAFVPTPADAKDFIEYEVKKGDTCIKIARKVYGDGDLCYALMAGSNDFDEKFRIYPGQKLKLPTKEQIAEQVAATERAEVEDGGPDAELKAFRGDVTARAPEDSDWQKASKDKELWRRWKVNSADSSSASVFFIRERATLRMRENTLVVIYGDSRSSKSTPSTGRHATLEKGTLATRLGELSGGSSAVASLEIETPGAVVNSEGGDALVTVTLEETTLVANHTSKSTKVRGRTKKPRSVSLPKNTGSKVEKGKDPTPPRPLPSPPVWDKPAFSAVSMAGESTVRASWQAVKDAAVWRVEVWRAAEKELIDVAVLDAKIREVVFEDFVPGNYELRIATIDSEGFESMMSDPVALTVKELLGNLEQLPEEARVRQARGELFLGEKLQVAEGLNCAYGGRRVYEQSVNASRTGSYTLTCSDAQGTPLPEQTFVVAPNNATLTKALPDRLTVDSVEEIRLMLDYPLEEIDVFFSDGFVEGGKPRKDEEGAWIIPVRAVEPNKRGELRIGTPGILGATLLKVPLQSADAQQVTAQREVEEDDKIWRAQLGAYAESRDLTGTGLLLGQERYDQGLRFGLVSGVQWRRRFIIDGMFDTGGVVSSSDDSVREQIFGLTAALSYRFGPWALKPYLRLGAGIDFIPSIDQRVGRAFGGGGLVWNIARRADLRLDIQQNALFDSSEDPSLMPGVTIGFAGTF